MRIEIIKIPLDQVRCVRGLFMQENNFQLNYNKFRDQAGGAAVVVQDQ